MADPAVPGGLNTIVDALGTEERQVWIGVDKPGLILTRIMRPITFLSPAARRQWIRMGRPAEVAVPGRRVGLPRDAFIRPYRQLLALPVNAERMWRMLYREAGKGSAAWKRHEMFTEVGDFLREEPLPAKVRAALYLAAARIPDIRLLGLDP